MQIDATQMHDRVTRRARGVLTRCYTITAKGDIVRESFPGVRHFRTNEMKGDGCMLAMLETCGRPTESVFGFVSLF